MKKLLLTLPVGVILLIGCSAPRNDIVAIQDEIVKTKKEVYKLKREQAEIKSQLNKLATRFDNISQMVSQNSLEIQQLKTKLRELEKKGVKTYKTKKKTNYKKTPSTDTDDTSHLTDKELYKRALEEYARQNFRAARKKFALLVKKYPYSKYYDNALFWIGQTYYMEGEYKRAIQFFDKIITECQKGTAPDCNKMPMAMLKKAYALINLGRISEAKKLLRYIVDHFPEDEEVVDLARRKLEALEAR